MEGSRRDLLNNQVCLVTWKGSDTKVTDFSNLSLAKNMALADQTVPVGQYTRKALINAGMAGSEYTEVDQLTDDVISKALGGLEINNCANVGAVASAVAEGANEVGTVYYSDTFGYEDQLDIIEQLPNSLTGAGTSADCGRIHSASYIQYKKTVWPFSGEQSWHSGSTYLAWLCAGGNGHRFSADVPQCESGL